MQMDGDLPHNTEVEGDIPICHQLGTDMIVPATAAYREVHDEDTLVLRDSLHHPERMPPDGLSVHHVAPVISSTQTSFAPTSASRSHLSCTTPVPWTDPPPTACTISPGSPSSPLEPSPTNTQPPIAGCSSTEGGKINDELPLPTARGTFPACSSSGETNNTAAVTTSRSASPTTAKSAGNQSFDTISRSQEGAPSEFIKSSGQFLIRLVLLLITSSFPLNPGAWDVSYQPMRCFSNLLRPATIGTGSLPSGPSEFGSFFRHATLGPMTFPRGPTDFGLRFKTHGLLPILYPHLH